MCSSDLNGRLLRAIQWNAAEHNDRLTSLKEGVEIAYTIEENEYQGTKYVELRLEDFRDSASGAK